MNDHHGRLSRTMVAALAGLVSLALAGRSAAHIELNASLTAAQEVPAPSGVPDGAAGTATFTLNEDAGAAPTLTYQITVHDLSGTPLFAHIHKGRRGVRGDVIIPLPLTPSPLSLIGETPALTEDQVEQLLDGELYVNFHTPANTDGEIRGQIELTRTAQTCNCKAAASPKEFRACVKQKIKTLGKDEKKEEGIKLLKKLFKKASCGKTTGPKKAIACCLPQAPDENIVIGHMCAAIPEKACTKIGGTSLGTGSSCFPTNPCTPPASPSGAFLDSAAF